MAPTKLLPNWVREVPRLNTAGFFITGKLVRGKYNGHMPLAQFLWPVKVAEYKSEYNDNIEVLKFMGSYRLDMGGLTQSGDIIRQIWSKGLRKLLPSGFVPKKVLLLGFGAGSAAKLLVKKWPGVHLIAVEIDPVVIKIGQKYFGTLTIPNLRVVNVDAVKFMEKLKTEKFDLIMVDCYQGYKIPARFQTLAFMRKLKLHSRFVLINRLFWQEHKAPSLKFLAKLRTVFTVNTARTASNLLLGIGN